MSIPTFFDVTAHYFYNIAYAPSKYLDQSADKRFAGRLKTLKVLAYPQSDCED